MIIKRNDSARALLIVLFIGAFLVVVSPLAASGAAVADDSAVGEDSAVAEDSPPQPVAIVRISVEIINDNGGTRHSSEIDLFVNSYGPVVDGDVIALPPGLRTLSDWSRGGYDIVDMRCVRTSDSALVTQSFTVEYPAGHPFGLLRVPLNNGADITCTVVFDDQQVGFHIFPIVDDTTPVDGLVTLIGDEALVGASSTLLDQGLYEFSSGTPGYRVDRLECTRHHGWTLWGLEFVGEIDIVLNGRETGCGAYFEPIPTPPPADEVVCTRAGSTVSWTAPESATVHVRSSDDGWLASFTGAGSYRVGSLEGDVFVRTRSGQTVEDVACVGPEHPPVRLVLCEVSGSVVRWTAPDGVKVHVRSGAAGWLASYEGSGTHRVDGTHGRLFIRTRIDGVLNDTDCTPVTRTDPDVQCAKSGSVVTWTMSEGRRVHVRSMTDGWLGSYELPGSLDVSDVEGEVFVRTRLNGMVLDTTCE